MATLKLFDAELGSLARTPALRPIADRLESAIAAALARDESETDVALLDLVGAGGEVMGLYWLLNGLPPGLACLCVRDAQGVVYEGLACLGDRAIQPAEVFCRLRMPALGAAVRPSLQAVSRDV